MNSLDVRIGFSTTNKIASRLIRWVTQAPCSHAWFSFKDQTLGMRMVMQAEWWGYEVRPWPRWVRENRLVAEFKLAEQDLALDQAVRLMAKELGTRYDFGAAAWVGFKGWAKRWLRSGFTLRPSRTPHQLMCSEAVVRLLYYAGFPFASGVDPELVSPGELLEILGSSPLFVTGETDVKQLLL